MKIEDAIIVLFAILLSIGLFMIATMGGWRKEKEERKEIDVVTYTEMLEEADGEKYGR
jgi:hypothetical protein